MVNTLSIITFGHERLSSNFPFFFLCSQVYVFQASVEPDSSYPLTPALCMITACGSQFPISKGILIPSLGNSFPLCC